MSVKKSGSSRAARPAPGPLRLAYWLAGSGRAPAAIGLLIAAFALGWFALWRDVREEVLASQSFWVGQAGIQVTPPADWIHTDIRAEVCRDASLSQPLYLLDADLVERLAKAFALHPWVREVRRVEKRNPATVYVDLIYRQPVAMVVVPGGCYPVDVEGVFLPTADFAATGAGGYPRVIGIDTSPVGIGTAWGDLRVIGAAQIAAAFGDRWQALGLERIAPSKQPDGSQEYTFDLLTARGTTIQWGHAPSTKVAGETPAEEKVAWLVDYGRSHGTLESQPGTQPLDLRAVRPVGTTGNSPQGSLP